MTSCARGRDSIRPREGRRGGPVSGTTEQRLPRVVERLGVIRNLDVHGGLARRSHVQAVRVTAGTGVITLLVPAFVDAMLKTY